MPTVTEYTPGTPCWIDLSTTDREDAMKFYTAVLGWTDYDVGRDGQGAVFAVIKTDGEPAL